MFTGIIQRLGTVEDIQLQGTHGYLVIRSEPFDRTPGIGDSIAVSGVCLTLTETGNGLYHFDVLAETFSKTNLGDRAAGDSINLEPALRYGDALGGHIVSGHIDGTGTVRAVEQAGERDHVLRISCAPGLMQYMVFKGSVAMDGVSLTLVDVEDDHFSVHIIPHTWTATSFSRLQVGDRVNVENDLLSKYVQRHLEGSENQALSWEVIQRFSGDVTG